MSDARLAVGLSGSGGPRKAILKADVPVSRVLADRPCRGLDIVARECGIPILLIERKRGEPFDRVFWTKRLVEKLNERRITHVALAGLETIVGPLMCERSAGRMINIHPSLLPKFPGAHAVRDTLASGEKFGGCTVHQVIEKVDAGAILAQERVR